MTTIGTEHWRKNVVLMWLSQLLVMAGFDASIPFVPLLLKDEFGIIAQGERGVYMSMFVFCGVLAYALFSPVWGTLGDRFGLKIMLLRGTFLTAFLFPLMAYVAPYVYLLLILRFLTAACAGTTSASHMLLVKTTPDNKQGFALGVLSTAVWGGAMLGHVVGGLVVHYYGYMFTFWICGIMYILAGVFVLFCQDAPKTVPVKHVAGPESVKTHRTLLSRLPKFTVSVWLMLLLFTLISLVRRFEGPFIPMKIELIVPDGFADYWTGLVSAAVSIGALFSGLIIGYLTDKCHPGKLLLPCFIFSVVFLFVQGKTENIYVLGITRTLMFFFAGGIIPVFQKILSGITPQRKRGSVFGWSYSAQNTGAMLATFFSGCVIYNWGTPAVFYTAAVLTAVMIPVTLLIVSKVTHDPYYLVHSDLSEKKS